MEHEMKAGTRNLQFGVIGLGFIGELHARVQAELPNATLVAVSDLDADRLGAVANRHGADAHSDYRQLLERDDIDAVSICLPDRLHLDAATAAARAGKAILLEKPMAHTAEAALQIKEAVESSGVRLMVGHVLRFDPRYVHVHDSIARGEFGKIIHLRAKRNSIRSTAKRLGSTSSIFYYMGVHDIDMLAWCAEARIETVYAQKVELLGTGNEDTVYAVLNFSNGAIGLLDYSWAWPDGLPSGYYAALEVVGTERGALLDVFDQGLHFIDATTVTQPDTHLWPEINGRIVGALRDELLHFNEAVLSGSDFQQPYEHALNAIRVVDALFESVETGRPVAVRYDPIAAA
jgi:predicted dehydrogenase